MRILLVDDDELLVHKLTDNLRAQNYVVDTATDGFTGWTYAQATTYDLIVLDVNLPELTGIQLCQRLRQNQYAGAILLLTARGDSTDKVTGLDAGADDYVVKPCSVEELTARMRALLRRPQTLTTPVLQWGALALNPSTREVTYQTQLINLSPKEYGLLELLLRNPQRIFSAGALLERLWGFEETPGEETVRTHIKRLRQKLKRAGVTDVIENIYGMGYRLKPPNEAPQTDRAEQARAAAIAALEKFRDILEDRLAALERVPAALERGQLTVDIQQQAQHAAHKLAGSLGMFGLPLGSELSRELEQQLQLAPERLSAAVLQPLITQLRQELALPAKPPEARPEAPPPVAPADPESLPRLLVVDDDTQIVAQLRAESARYPLHIEAIAEVEAVRSRLAVDPPDAVLLDLALPNQPADGLALLETITQHYPQLPVLIFTVYDGFQERLAAARRKSCVFLSKTAPVTQVLDTVQDVLRRRCSHDLQVLAVDDDPMVLAQLDTVLSRWGIEVKTLAEAESVWSWLQTLSPDLLILDVEMPALNGLDLCRTIRNDNTFQGLPILFLTARNDAESICEMFRAGADDYVPKPFTEPELVTRILNRVERNRLLRSLATADALTGLASRRQAAREISLYLAMSRRYHQPLCLALLDLTACPLPAAAGQAPSVFPLQPIVNRLQELFRNEDVIAHWGDRLFLISMYGMTQSQAVKRLRSVLQAVRSIVAAGEGAGVSAGIAIAPDNGMDLQTLYQAAETALQQARDAGGGIQPATQPAP